MPESKPLTFEDVYTHQIDMQVNVYGDGTPLTELDELRKIQFVKDNYIALIMEMGEALDETGWKPWASSNHFNRDAFKGEMVDVLHFFINLLGVAGVEPSELFESYFRKADVNLKRQVDGYDGVSTKCPGCQRALDDEAVKCYEYPDQPDIFWCDEKKSRFNRAAIRPKKTEEV